MIVDAAAEGKYTYWHGAPRLSPDPYVPGEALFTMEGKCHA